MYSTCTCTELWPFVCIVVKHIKPSDNQHPINDPDGEVHLFPPCNKKHTIYNDTQADKFLSKQNHFYYYSLIVN